MSAPSKAGGAVPLAGICCLGLMCFLIASTIILALIPLYVPTKTVTVVTPAADANTFQLQYSSGGLDRANTASGQLDNVNSISNSLGLNGATVTEGHAKATYATATTRRRRNLLVRRRRAVVGTMQINLKCQYAAGTGCIGACAERNKVLVKQSISATSSVSFGLSVRYGGRVLSSPEFRCNYAGLQDTATRPKGYNSVDSLDFVASKSGDINEPDTWQNGVVPFNGCGVTVLAGINLILSGTSLAIPLASLRVAPGASLTLGSPGQAGFVFEIALAMVISGTLSFQGSGGALILPAGSNLAFSETAAYVGAAIVIQTITASGQIITITSISSDLIPTSVVISSDGVPSVVSAANSTTVAPGETTTTTAAPGETTTTTAAPGETTTTTAASVETTTTTTAAVETTTTTTAAVETTTTTEGETTTTPEDVTAGII